MKPAAIRAEVYFHHMEVITSMGHLQALNNKLKAYCCSFQVCNLEEIKIICRVFCLCYRWPVLTSYSFVPVSFPRIFEGQITWPRGGHPPWCHRLYSNCCQEGLVASQWCTAQFCKGKDLGQESKWAQFVYCWKCISVLIVCVGALHVGLGDVANSLPLLRFFIPVGIDIYPKIN